MGFSEYFIQNLASPLEQPSQTESANTKNQEDSQGNRIYNHQKS